MSDTPAPTLTYKVVLEQGGMDGPYTVDQLRELLILGRVRSTDRLMVTVSHTITTVKEVIEDAGRISELRPALREQALQEKQQRLKEAQDLAAAQAQAASPAEIAPPEDSAMAEFQRRAALQKNRTKHVVVIGLGFIACVVGLWYAVTHVDIATPSRPSAGMAVNNKIFGNWTVQNSWGNTALDGAQITISEKTFTISPKEGQPETLAIKGMTSFGPGYAAIQFEKAHALLGPQVSLSLTSTSLRVNYFRKSLDCVARDVVQ